jgi:hypothetical protein
MKNILSAILFFAVMVCMNSGVFAAELLDVKPVVAGNSVSVEITADVAMTYTYYKIPGQARAVVDIAEADPEKVEPLIVVNKGAVSSISVDKALISDIVVSRIIFNLVSESEISVTAAPDRKRLTVTFGGMPATAAAKPETKPEPKEEPKQEPAPLPPPEPAVKNETSAVSATTPPATGSKEEDPLGLDEPADKSAAPIATAVPAAKAVSGAAVVAAPTVVARVPKLEPVVPVTVTPAKPAMLTINEIVTGTSFIEIRANRTVSDYKVIKLTSPDRLVIDIAGEKIVQKAKSFAINKFGISNARIGISPKNIRIVIDSSKVGFPAHTISNSETGLRISFNK